MYKFCTKTGGFSLLEMTVATAISLVSATIVYQQIIGSQKVTRNLSSDSDVAEIATTLSSTVDCTLTLQAIRNANGGTFPATGTPVQLINGRNQAILGAPGPTGSPYQMARMIRGDWYALVLWIDGSISVQIARIDSDRQDFDRHPIAGTPLNFNARRHTLYGSSGTAGGPLCPIRNESNTNLIAIESTTTGTINDLLFRPTTETCAMRKSDPLEPTIGCHRYCTGRGYTTGYFSTCRDQEETFDANGDLASSTQSTAGNAYFECACLK